MFDFINRAASIKGNAAVVAGLYNRALGFAISISVPSISALSPREVTSQAGVPPEFVG